MESDFIQNKDEPSVKKKVSGSIVIFHILYMYVTYYNWNNIPRLQRLKIWLSKQFSMKDLGEASYILGIKIYRDRSIGLLGLSQFTYIEKILKGFSINLSKKGFIPIVVHVS